MPPTFSSLILRINSEKNIVKKIDKNSLHRMMGM